MKLMINLFTVSVLLFTSISCWGPIDPEDNVVLADSLSVYKDTSGELYSDIDSSAIAGNPFSVYVGANSFQGVDSLSVYYLSVDSTLIDSNISFICSSYTDTILNIGQITFNRSGLISLFYSAYYTDSVDAVIFDTIAFFVKGNAPGLTVDNDTVYTFETSEWDTLKLTLSTVSKYLYSKSSIISVDSLPIGASYDSALKTIIYIPDTSVTKVDSLKIFDSIIVAVVDSSIPPVYDTFLLTISVKDSVIIPLNNKPVFKDSLPQASYLVDEGDTVVIPFLAEDTDSSDSVTYFITNNLLPGSAVYDTIMNKITWITGINDSGSYSITINATDGKDTTSINVAVGVGDVNLAPNIVIGDFNSGDTLFIKEGSPLIFQVTATDANIGDSIFLNKLDSVPWANSSVGEGSYDTVSGSFSFLPYITAVDSMDSILVMGPYSFSATDNGVPPLTGNLNLYIAVVDSLIITQKIAPKIITSPSSTTTLEGDSVSFSVVATGSDLQYQWLCNDTLVTGATNSLLTIYSLSVSDSGNVYKCNVYNSDSSVTSGEAILSVIPKKPVIVTSPISDTVFIGESVVFYVSATGSKLTYQWYKNSIAIAGEINDTLSIVSSIYSDSGAIYTCKVSNSGGDTTSAGAELIVKNPASVFYDLVDTIKASINDTLQISFSVTDAQKIKEIKWSDGAGEHTFKPDSLKDSLFVEIDVITGGAEGDIVLNLNIVDSCNGNTSDSLSLIVTDNIPVFSVALPETLYVGWGDSVKLQISYLDDGQNVTCKYKYDFYDFIEFDSNNIAFILKESRPCQKNMIVMVLDDDNNSISHSIVIVGEFNFTPKMSNLRYTTIYAIEKWKGKWHANANCMDNLTGTGTFNWLFLESEDLLNWNQTVGRYGGSFIAIGYNDKYCMETPNSGYIGQLYYSPNTVDDLIEIMPQQAPNRHINACDILTAGNSSYLFSDSGLYVLDPDNVDNPMLKVGTSPLSEYNNRIIVNHKSDSLVYFVDGNKLYKLRENTSNPFSLVNEMNMDSLVTGDIVVENGVLWLFTPDNIKCSKDFGTSWFLARNLTSWANSNFIQAIRNEKDLYIYVSGSGNNVFKYSGPLTYPE